MSSSQSHEIDKTIEQALEGQLEDNSIKIVHTIHLVARLVHHRQHGRWHKKIPQIGRKNDQTIKLGEEDTKEIKEEDDNEYYCSIFMNYIIFIFKTYIYVFWLNYFFLIMWSDYFFLNKTSINEKTMWRWYSCKLTINIVSKSVVVDKDWRRSIMWCSFFVSFSVWYSSFKCCSSSCRHDSALKQPKQCRVWVLHWYIFPMMKEVD